MNEKKRKKLEAAGWKCGSAYDFLEMTDEEASYFELKLVFSDAVRKLRRQRHLTQAQLAKLLRSSQSRVAKAEAGDASVSLDLPIWSLLTLGASSHIKLCRTGIMVTAECPLHRLRAMAERGYLKRAIGSTHSRSDLQSDDTILRLISRSAGRRIVGAVQI